MIEWMQKEKVADDFMNSVDMTSFGRGESKVTQEILDQLEVRTRNFFMTRTKAEILDGAVKHKVQTYPVATTAEIAENPQLAARGFWVEVEHPELNTAITYPGAFGNFSDAPPRITRRAPLIGEHNQDIYHKELGFSKEELTILKQAGVI